MNLYHQRQNVQIATNRLAHTGVGIALATIFGTIPAVFLITGTFHSIMFKCGMDDSLRSQTFWPTNFLWTLVITQRIVLQCWILQIFLMQLPDEFEPQEPTDWRTNCQSQSNLIIVSSVSIFEHSVRWCHCMKSLDQYIQLLHAKLFLANFRNPKTVFTFEVLDHFQLDALECKMSAINFMSKIQWITNEAFLSNVLVSISRYRITILH